MVSIDRGGGLRVHLGYAWAPDEVIRAIVVWARTRRHAHRRTAARTLLGFPAVQHAPPPSPRNPRHGPASQPPASPCLQAWLGRLRRLYASLNARHFGNALGPVDLIVSTRMRRRLGHFEPGLTSGESGRIVLSRRHIMRDGWAAAADTMLHEMVHQWQSQSGLPLDHGPTFRRKALEVGIEPAAVWTRTD
jgi:SprT-like family